MGLKTFEDCVNEVLRYGFNDGPQVNKERIERWINEAQTKVARHSFAPVFQKKTEITMVAGKFEYTLPSGVIRIQTIVYPEGAIRLKPVDLQTFESYKKGSAEIEGPPSIYHIRGVNELYIFPNPTSAAPLIVFYIEKPPELVNPTDVPVLEGESLNMLVDYALFRAYRAEDDLEAANVHHQQFEEDLASYKKSHLHLQDDTPKQLRGTWSV